MKFILTATLVLISILGMCQDESVKQLQKAAAKSVKDDTTHKSGWKKGATLNLGIAQGATSNWAAGGERSSLAINTYVNLFSNYKHDKIRWSNNLDLFYAVMNNSSQGKRKNDDRIDLFSKYTYQVKPKLGFGMVGNFRTQFTDGYDYSKTPFARTSTFMSPAYVTLAPGFDWSPTNYFSIFFSPISARFVYVEIGRAHV
jgi:hypothetical protein